MFVYRILDKRPRFRRSNGTFQNNEALGKLIGIYNNFPIGDDLYVHDKGIYWHADEVDYNILYNELKLI